MRISSAIKKYPFLLFVFAAGRRMQRVLSVWFWTTYTKVLLRLFGCSYGKGLTVDGHVWIRVRQKGAIKLGDHVSINSRFGSNLVGLNTPTILECLDGGYIEIGDNSGCSGAIISSRSSVKIGRYVKVGGNVRIFDHDFHSLDPELRSDSGEDYKNVKSVPVVVGDTSFIGTNAIILKGAYIGEKTIIAAGSVLAVSTGVGEIWGGNPARCLKVLNATG